MPQKIDSRLLGTWKSDVDRTLAALRLEQRVSAKREADFRKQFGKLRITYTAEAYVTEFADHFIPALNGKPTTYQYKVLGLDQHSVVIQSCESESDPAIERLSEELRWSSFTIIHFEGPETYSVHVAESNLREYFQRMK